MEKYQFYKQTYSVNRGGVGSSLPGFEKPQSSETQSFMGSQFDQRSNFGRVFQKNKYQTVSKYINEKPPKSFQSSASDRSTIVEYPVDIYPKSSVENMRFSSFKQAKSHLRGNNFSNDQSRDLTNNYSVNVHRSPVSSGRNDYYQRNPIILDRNPDISYCRPSLELDSRRHQRSPEFREEYRILRNQRSPDRNTGFESQQDIWRSSPERYRSDAGSYNSFPSVSNIPSLFDSNLIAVQPGTTNTQQNLFTRRSNSNVRSVLTEAERSLGYTTSSSLTEAERSLRFKPPAQSNYSDNQPRDRANLPLKRTLEVPQNIRNKFSRPFTSVPAKRNEKLRSSNAIIKKNKPSMGTQKSSNAFVMKNRKRKGTIPLQIGTEKRLKFQPPAKLAEASKKHSGELIKKGEIKQPVAETYLETGKISGDNITPSSATPTKRKKKNKKKNAVVIQPKYQVENLTDLSIIFLRNFPFQKMNKDQTILLRESLEQELEKVGDKSFQLHFVTSYRRRGCVVVLCRNESGVEWLKKTLETLEPWEGANFKAVRQGSQTFSLSVIVPNEFPKKYMTFEQLSDLQASLSSKMEEIDDDSALPQFVDGYPRRGTFMVAVSRQEDNEWLKNVVKDLQPWEGAQLRVIHIDDLPDYYKIKLWVPFPPTDLDTVLMRLERQNTGLSTSNWYVMKQTEKDGGHDLVVSVEEDVIKALEMIDFKPFLNFNRITVENLGKTRNVIFTDSEYERSLWNSKFHDDNQKPPL
ncbi:uncharacterized protein [Leptinotarsa decemlineata]|uniref:uncharacterized protein n=1 Tax=Leptinotarsa decemlineata TaxID=7539 RepID=UPI003D3041B0